MNDNIKLSLALIVGTSIIIFIAFINFVYLPSQPHPSTTTPATTYILDKFYPLTGISIYNNITFYTNTSPTGCISYAIAKNYKYNVTSQSLYIANETKITNATVIEKLYNTMGGAPVYGSNQQKRFITENGTNNYVTILKNQTLLCK